MTKPKPKTKEQLTFEAGYNAAVENLIQKEANGKEMQQAFVAWKDDNPKETPLTREWKRLNKPAEVTFDGVVWAFTEDQYGRVVFHPKSGGIFGDAEK
jgi:hypothetical protein